MVMEGQTTGGESRQDPAPSTIPPSKVFLSSYTVEDLASKQREDPDISFVYESLLKGRKRPSSSEVVTKRPAARHYWVIWNSLSLDNGLVVKECLQKNGLSKYFQLLIPRCLKKEVLKEVHNARMGGHFDCRKTYERVKQKYYWYEMRDEVNNWVLTCDVCAADKIPQKKPCAPLGSLGVGAVLATLSTDFVGPFPI